MKELYEQLARRKSMRKFDCGATLSQEEQQEILALTKSLIPLTEGIEVKFRLVEKGGTTAKFGDYCLLLYSQKQSHYLLNAGYLLEQMDLLLANRDLGCCWLGLAKPDLPQYEGLDFVVMLTLGKSKPRSFRTGSRDFHRKPLNKIWHGAFDPLVTEAVRLAPSACNCQPWRFASADNKIQVYREPHPKTIIPPGQRPFLNSLDLGIALCFLDIALLHGDYAFSRTLQDEEKAAKGWLRIAEYQINEAIRGLEA